jgi:hypothetical protein
LLTIWINYLLGFENLYVSTSGLDITEHTHVERAVKLLGGHFYKDLEKGVTNLLITDRPSGPKFEHMARNRLSVVRMSWLQRSIEEVILSFKIWKIYSAMMMSYYHC